MAQVFIGIGSSINKLASITAGLHSLQNEFGMLNISPVYESEAVGFNGENFYNLVVEFTTELTITALIARLKAIEIVHGRAKKTIKYAPRTLDLDLLLYDQVIDQHINIPRAEITKNAFVLKPLADLAPQLSHPILGKTYRKLWDNYPPNTQNLWQIKTNLFI